MSAEANASAVASPSSFPCSVVLTWPMYRARSRINSAALCSILARSNADVLRHKGHARCTAAKASSRSAVLATRKSRDRCPGRGITHIDTVARTAVAPSAVDEQLRRRILEALADARLLHDSPPLAPALQLVVALLPTGFIETNTCLNRIANLCLGHLDALGNLEHFVLACRRNGNDAIGIAAQQITATHARIADVDDTACGFQLHAILSCAHRIAAAENGIAEFQCQVCVPTRTINDRACNAAAMRAERQNISQTVASGRPPLSIATTEPGGTSSMKSPTVPPGPAGA